MAKLIYVLISGRHHNNNGVRFLHATVKLLTIETGTPLLRFVNGFCVESYFSF